LSYSFDDKSVFISGGCGSLGSSVVARILKTEARRIVVYDNNQSGLVELERRYRDPRLRFFVGDVRDLPRLRRGLEGCDVAFHCAALKIVTSCEYNPMEAIKTNVLGSQNFVEACLDVVPEIAIGVSTDKACSPLNLYGATKLCMERLFIAANQYKGARKTVFSCVRYGNVLGSADSVIEVWIDEVKNEGKITVTDPEMTRFSIANQQAVDFIFESMKYARGSEIFIPKLKSYALKDLARAFVLAGSRNVPMEIKGLRVGEKDHELLINEHEMRFAYEAPFGYVLVQPTGDQRLHPEYTRVTGLSSYSSEIAERLTTEDLVALLRKEGLVVGPE
jgi:UDP-N-acetylglucosamine 4,6-dehydratase/UDP-glucose 4-epimerase